MIIKYNRHPYITHTHVTQHSISILVELQSVCVCVCDVEMLVVLSSLPLLFKYFLALPSLLLSAIPIIAFLYLLLCNPGFTVAIMHDSMA